MKHVLTIAGSDSSGGAGIQADLKTFAAHGVFGASVITAITAQNTQGVLAVENVSAKMITHQLEAVFSDIRIDAVKIGMVSCKESIVAIADALGRFQPPHIVLDPVMISKSGYPLMAESAMDLLLQRLFPLASLVTPNIPEANWITNQSIQSISDMKGAAEKLMGLGPGAVLVKGGHRREDATDILFDGIQWHCLAAERIMSKHTHGTGCTLSSAIASNLGKQQALYTAVANAKRYIQTCISSGLAIGKGIGPLNHFSVLYKNAGMDIGD